MEIAAKKVPAPVAGENIRTLGTALAPRRTVGNMLAKTPPTRNKRAARTNCGAFFRYKVLRQGLLRDAILEEKQHLILEKVDTFMYILGYIFHCLGPPSRL